jgi:hypothetical protein
LYLAGGYTGKDHEFSMNRARGRYNEGLEWAEWKLKPINLERLRMYLKLATFLHDVVKDSVEAARLASSAWRAADRYLYRGERPPPDAEDLIKLLAQRRVSQHNNTMLLVVLTALNRMNGAWPQRLVLPATISDYSIRLFLYGLAVIHRVEMESPSFGMPMPMSSLESHSCSSYV